MKYFAMLFIYAFVSACATTEEAPGKSEIYTISNDADKAYTESDWVTAEVNYTRLTMLVPNDDRAYFKLGNIYLKQGKTASAISSYNAAIFRDPDKAKYYNNIAVARIMQAKQALKMAIDKALPTDGFLTNAKVMLIRLNNINKRSENK